MILLAVWRKVMMPNSKRDRTFASVLTDIGQRSRRAGHLLVEAVQSAYDSHMARTQMRLAPLKIRSWREIPRVGAHETR